MNRVPASTYRLQIRESFDLDAARELLGYLDELGVGWVYLSPILEAHPGSDHGYDVVDPTRVDPARGGAEALARLSAEAHRRGMGVLVDVVPNHVGVESPATNGWWWDVLKHGRDSRFGRFFDVDWAAGRGRILLPVLGDDDQPEPDGAIGNLRVVDGMLGYHDHRFPLAPGTAEDTDDPQVVHQRQHYRLVSWRAADDELDYRRFFAVNTLAGVRVEDRDVFEASHVEIARWFRERLVDGLRVDHPDGLRHPAAYLDDLADLTGGAWVVVEKILEPGEDLPARWNTAGTTGYEVLALIDRVLVDPAGEAALGALDDRLRGGVPPWPELVRANKRHVADTILHAEVRRIAREIAVELEVVPDRAWREPVEEVLVELLAAFPVYRSYLPAGREHLRQAADAVRADRPDLGAALDLVLPLLADRVRAPALRFQQTSGMIMAKGVEDRAFYRWSRLTSLNEVGADPAEFSVAPGDFHAAMARRQAVAPEAMTTLSTHDTKRGEDVRARIGVLAEDPAWWSDTLAALLAAAPAPDAGFAHLLWQAAVGAWPLSRERLHGYAEKAMREAGDRTTWTAPDASYEKAVHALVDAAYDDPAVVALLDEAAAHLAGPGWSNALAAKLLSLTVPGVPDVYQGSELWEQSLVDPDNRRAVDFSLRRRLLADAGPVRPDGPADDGRAKLHVVRTALRLRRDRPDLFARYYPVDATGAAADHVLAFDRGGAIAVVTRLPLGLERAGGWRDTRLHLPPGEWRELLTDRPATAEVGVLLSELPVALLVEAAG
ncbi:malto-oligosyltrehalose synthase [Nocardioides nitrophenolicus]|uniref:malto-oligosyltrehalose synthase n=1 Tax=Nocardioides nitrophenolicus TaxID=60489 RepID=UPI0019570EB2|nr:malto-oligosyltrehalose synthase [Nocardioides nitrophenolicus]MBM7517925.1 (1->4)-alpha-D-glucan 1-alpha-D-glucosylmutase [Nocardioides nitrophenolicus]